VDASAGRSARGVYYVTEVDDETRLAAARLDQVAERIKIGAAVLAGLLLAFAISITLLYVAIVLVGRQIYRTDGSD
jgi:hypothetical protein